MRIRVEPYDDDDVMADYEAHHFLPRSRPNAEREMKN